MAELTLALGTKVELDLDHPEHGRMMHAIDAEHRKLAAKLAQQPAVKRLDGSAIADGANPAIIRVGEPPANKVWEIHRVLFVPHPNPLTAVANVTVGTFIGRPPRAAEALDPFDLIDFGTTFPYVTPWGRPQAQVRPGQWIYGAVVGAGANQQIAVTVLFTEIDRNTEKAYGVT